MSDCDSLGIDIVVFSPQFEKLVVALPEATPSTIYGVEHFLRLYGEKMISLLHFSQRVYSATPSSLRKCWTPSIGNESSPKGHDGYS